ncbi:MAG TPA: FAD-binding oxidoreductase [Burkholderiales bacterium]|nr:FAD-binding oxidoreductase [Burkholderiales bacterium]
MNEATRGYGRYESWFRDRIQSDTGPIETPQNEDDVARILTDPVRFPSPVRPVGSRHSMTPCMSAAAPRAASSPQRWGTIVDMTGLTRLRGSGGDSLRLIPDADGKRGTVTVPAGRTFISVARELGAQGWVFRVNTELGPLTVGAAACGATKDSSFPGESGQVCHDVIGMRVVKPNGERADFKEGDRDFNALRCSYGLFGIVTEVTFRVFPLEYISLRHEKIKPEDGKKFTSHELRKHIGQWLGRDGNENAVFLYMFPYRDRIVAELRAKPATEGEPDDNSLRLQIRNHFWDEGAHDWEEFARSVPLSGLKHKLQDLFDKTLEQYFARVLRLARINPVAQIVDFDPTDPKHRFTFSMWAFPEDEFPEILPRYFELCEKHEATYRSGLPHASYHIGQDTSSLLSYSRKGPVWTLDPICPDNVEGWQPFLSEFNEFCSSRGGMPLLNQTPYLRREQVQRAFADCLSDFEAARRRFDPDGRMLNAYFGELLRA